MRPVRSHLIACAILALAAPAVAQEKRSASPAQIEALIQSYGAKGLDVEDATVLVARDGVPVFRGSVGLANREWGIKSDPEVAYRVGSITKQFVAAAILQLAAAQKLSLDDPISKFVSDSPPAWRMVTIRHLLAHTSGIANFTALPEFDGRTWMYKTGGDVVGLVRDRPLEGVPGAVFSYDNTGYVILGLIVEKASGKTLGDYLSAHIFSPLGMRHTGFVSDQVLPHRATGYIFEGSVWNDTPWMSNVIESGAGGLYSTVDDLLRWDQALYDPKRLQLADLNPMFTDYGHGFGFGYVVGSEGGHRVWWHNGHIGGFGAMLARYPDDRLTIIILSNDDDAHVEALSRDLAALLLKMPKPSQ
jgi:D-alanyl-D-alanine carboxypeptidase